VTTTNGISGTSNSGAASTSRSTSQTSDSSELGQDAFLKLLITQLKNQDPTKPVDNQAFVAQLAQFSSLQELQGVSDRLDTLLVSQRSSANVTSASMLGKTVVYKTDTVRLDGTSGATVDLTLSDEASSVTAVISDPSGKVVRTITGGASSAGQLGLAWDGRDQNGSPLPAGAYSVSVTAKKSDGSTVSVVERGRGVVQGVDYSGSSTKVIVGGDTVSLSDVIQVDQQ
jgi:flagellar basal-body rod modification protein FlgD